MRYVRLCAVLSITASLLFAGCGEKKKEGPVDPSRLGYFLDSYEKSRAEFFKISRALKKKYSDAELTEIRVDSKKDPDLTVDCLYIPAKKKEKLIVMSCGVHGVEGHAGSAVQRMFMKEVLPSVDTKTVGVLFIHAVNPYGFKYGRRVSENNVDMNRCFDNTGKLYETKNEGYRKVYAFLNPRGTVDSLDPHHVFFPVMAVYNIVKYSMASLRQAVLQGQYEFEKGVYFGGKRPEPQTPAIMKLLRKTIDGYGAVFSIDLHTGYGEPGRLHFFPNPIKDQRNMEATRMLFEGTKVDWGDSKDFYTVTGEFTGLVELASRGRVFIMMPFEYGTEDSLSTLGSIRAIHVVIMENQGYHHGYAGEEQKKEMKKRFLEWYYPSSPFWRSEVMRQSVAVLPELVKRYNAFEVEKKEN